MRIAVAGWLILVGAGCEGAGAPSGTGSRIDPSQPSSRASVDRLFGKIPVSFVENRGQVPGPARYYVPGERLSVFFTPDGVTFSLRAVDPAWTVKLAFVGSDPRAEPVGRQPAASTVSYFSGSPDEWTTGVPTYSRVRYEDLWPGIDLIYSGQDGRLKYSFLIEPGADPSDIRLRYQGASSVRVMPGGALRVATPVGGFTDAPPAAYQVAEGGPTPVPAAFDPISSRSGGGFGFWLGAHDPRLPLVIDPEVLAFATYLGGTDFDQAFGIAVDQEGSVYVAGRTRSAPDSFPATTGPDLTDNGEMDAFVAKLSADGTQLLYAGYLGGERLEQALAIAVDAEGAAYVTGVTGSRTSFPVIGGPGLTFGGGATDAFVAKVDPSGTHLLYSGYIGGSRSEEGKSVAVDPGGHAYVTGFTFSAEDRFPVVGGPDLTLNNPEGEADDAFVAKLNPSGTGFVYAGYIGGAGADSGRGIAIDAGGSAYVTGVTHSDQATFPVQGGPDLTYNGGGDVFVAKVVPSGRSLAYAGYIGGSGLDESKALAVHGSGAAYISGLTDSSHETFPVRVGPDLTYNGGALDAFVAAVAPSGDALEYAGYIGGAQTDSAWGAAVDGEGRFYVSGRTDSDELTFPVISGPDLTYGGGLEDAFVARVAPSGAALDYAGYVGGKARDQARKLAIDAEGGAYIAGQTYSYDLAPAGVPGHDLDYGGGSDAFLAKVIFIDQPSSRCDPLLTGSPGPDTLVGTPGPDLICGGGGDDVLNGRGGDDVLRGGPGDDRLFGGAGDDLLQAQLGDDQLRGGPGDDTLLGGGGKDRCVDSRGHNRRFGCDS